jgi:hypothetical protein
MSTHAVAALTALALSFPVHGHNVQVHTMVAPDESPSVVRTVRVTPVPAYLGGISPARLNPRLNDAVTTRSVQQDLVTELQRRGFTVSDANPDAILVYYLAVPVRGDVSDWDHNYLWRPSWWRNWGTGVEDASPAEYYNGAIVVELVDPATDKVLWRGHAVAQVPRLEARYQKNLKTAVRAIVAELPGNEAGAAE